MDLVTDQLRLMAQHHPDCIAFRRTDGPRLTFAEWDRASNRLARGLVAAGVAKGDRAGILLESDEVLRWITTYSAIHKAGAVAVPVNTRLARPEIERILRHAEVTLLVSGGPMQETAESMLASVPSLHTLVSVSAAGGGLSVPWDEALATDDGDIQVPVSPDDLADIMYTSGTTGSPKGVAVRHRSVSQLPNALPAWTGAYWMYGNPLFTFAGLGPIYLAMKLGMSCLYHPRFDAGQWLATVERERPLVCFIVPAMAQLLVAHPTFDSADLSSVALCFVGSAPVAAATVHRLRERMPNASITNAYGMSEAGGICSIGGDDLLAHPGSVGRPQPPVEIRIVDEQGDDLPAGEVGEILFRQDGMQREYFDDAAATAAAWADGWLHTGDLGRLDEDGYLYIAGRKKDVIIRGGHNIHAADVEAVLYECPDVVEAAVVGVPHDVLGEDVAAVVVIREGARIDSDGLKAFCATRLADYKCPRRIVLASELPRNPAGKVVKHELVARLSVQIRSYGGAHG